MTATEHQIVYLALSADDANHNYTRMFRAFVSSIIARVLVYCQSIHLAGVVAMAAATEYSDAPQMKELLNKDAALTAQIELKVSRSAITVYSHTPRGQSEAVRILKFQALLQSRIGEQYCLGVAMLNGSDEAELKTLQDHFQDGSIWKFSSIKLLEEEDPVIHTTCRIVIDLRNSVAQALLQSVPFPPSPVPTFTIAEVPQLQPMQCFDLMAIPVQVLATRRTRAGMLIAGVRLVDGSVHPVVDAAETPNAALPLTIHFKSLAEFMHFQQHVGCTPLLFMCLAGYRDESGTVQVTTLEDTSWWQAGAGTAYESMIRKAPDLCDVNASLVDVARVSQNQWIKNKFLRLGLCRKMLLQSTRKDCRRGKRVAEEMDDGRSSDRISLRGQCLTEQVETPMVLSLIHI